MKRRLAIGLSVIAAAAAGGGAYAASRNGGSNEANHQAFLNDVAKRLHVTPQQLANALKGAAIDRLNAAVASGRLTQSQANALRQRIEQGQLPPFGEHRMHGFGGPPPMFPALIGAAGYLGLMPAQLLHQLESGKSLAQIAAARGKSVSGLKAAITAQIRSRLDQAVAGGVITPAREQQILSDLASRLDDLINRVHRPGFGGNGRFGGHGLAAPQMAQPPAGAMPPAGPTY